jgi:hypothetical protein
MLPVTSIVAVGALHILTRCGTPNHERVMTRVARKALWLGLVAALPGQVRGQEPFRLLVDMPGVEISALDLYIHRGYAVVPASRLTGLGWQVTLGESGAELSGPNGTHVVIHRDSPFVQWGTGEILQLTDAPYRSGGDLMVPLQLVTDILPQRLAGTYAFDGPSMTLRVLGPEVQEVTEDPEVAEDPEVTEDPEVAEDPEVPPPTVSPEREPERRQLRTAIPPPQPRDTATAVPPESPQVDVRRGRSVGRLTVSGGPVFPVYPYLVREPWRVGVGGTVRLRFGLGDRVSFRMAGAYAHLIFDDQGFSDALPTLSEPVSVAAGEETASVVTGSGELALVLGGLSSPVQPVLFLGFGVGRMSAARVPMPNDLTFTTLNRLDELGPMASAGSELFISAGPLAILLSAEYSVIILEGWADRRGLPQFLRFQLGLSSSVR